ncbi:MAG: hypothetical protein ACJARO_000122 [Bacteriovoracaceae bacterium]|jgi:hypothetical protein|tara:strand:+ start:11826 stop:13910 length:2085 start_codon:yes stop_codon:yes gene_type:complete
MSVYLINKTINDLNLSGLKIFYNFNDYSGDYINSISGGDEKYSGHIVNYNSSFTGQNSGSGFFNGQYIEIENSSDITSESATILFSQRKTGVSNGVIFSHLDPDGPSGWEVGINEANKYYFKNFVDGSPYYQTLDAYLSDKNLCALKVNEFGEMSLGKLDFSKKIKNIINEGQGTDINYYGLDKERVYVPQHSVSNGSNWKLGSGEFLYEGYMDYFLYFNVELSDDSIRQFARSIHSDATFIPEVSGIESGVVTGYYVSKSGVSGEVGIGYNQTGSITQSGYYLTPKNIPKTGTVGVSGFVYVPHFQIDSISGTDQVDSIIYKKIQNLSYTFGITGDPEPEVLSNYKSSGSYWDFSGNSGTFESQSAVGPSGHIFGITGFDSIDVTGYYTGGTQGLFEKNINSGIVYEEYSYSGLVSPSTGYLISGSYYLNGDNQDPTYYANAISLIGRCDKDDLYEVIYDVYEGALINNNSTPNNNSTYNKNVVYTTGDLYAYETYLAINGVSEFTGSISLYKNQYNFPEFQVTSGFYLSGSEVFTELNLDGNDKIIYDSVYSGEKNSLVVNSLNDYNSAPFTNFDFYESQIFLNGVKIYSGIDYIDSAGFFPINQSTGITGAYFTYKNYTGALRVTGRSDDPINIKHDEITPVGYIYFLNGIRQPFGSIIEHAGYSDLISGTSINKENNILYSMINGVNQVL